MKIKQINFKSTLCQEDAKKILSRLILEQKIPHALLFIGAEGVGKLSCAVEFARNLLCQSKTHIPCLDCSSCRKIS
ncbi:MAG: DNA polymerase III subunit delta', partial [bacterium]